MSTSRRLWIAAASLMLFVCLAVGQTAQTPLKKRVLTAETQDEMIIVRIDEVMFICYRFGAGQKYPYFYPVNGPLSGLPLTTESSLPYPHHRSLWFGWDRVNGGNYWQEGNERGQIVSRRAKVTVNGPDRIQIRDECDWRQPGQPPIISDRREIAITAPSDAARIIDFAIRMTALTDIAFEKTNHSLFSARMTPALSVAAGGVLVNAEGKSGEKETAGRPSPWMDYYGTRFGLTEGLAIFDAPGNLWYPSRWFTRDYGFFSPTNLNWIDDKGLRLKTGESFVFRYRVVVHAGSAAQADLAGEFSRWTKALSK